MSRGAPPAIEIRARRPVRVNGATARRFNETAISPDFEIARISASASPNGRDSGLSGRLMKISKGLPSQAAE